jgi:hypothetical protein
MMKSKEIYALLAAAGVATACGPKTLVPPRLDLAPLNQVGLTTFTIENAKGDLNELATEYFLAEMLDAQPGISVIELGAVDRLLEDLGGARLNRDVLNSIGAEHDVPVIFAGHMKVSDVTPHASLSGFPSVGATVSVRLTVRMLSTESGGTLWSSSIQAKERVGELGLSGSQVVFAAQDPNEAYGDLVEYLVVQVTRDLRPTYR